LEDELHGKAAVAPGTTSDATFAAPLALHGIAEEALALVRSFSTIDHALEWVDQIFEDQLRELQTALVLDIPASGVDVDHDFWAERIDEQRREWGTQRAQLRRELLEWLAQCRA
jgi:hypothetical protein